MLWLAPLGMWAGTVQGSASGSVVSVVQVNPGPAEVEALTIQKFQAYLDLADMGSAFKTGSESHGNRQQAKYI